MNNQYQFMNQYQRYGNTINWVQGIEGAKAYQIAPNSNVMMLDSENDGVFYIKTSDNVGMCNMRTFKFEEVTNASPVNADLTQYVRKDELKKMIEEVLNEQAVSATSASV